MSVPLKLGYVGYGGSVRNFHLPFVRAVQEVEVYAFLQRSEAPSAEERKGSTAKPHCLVDFPHVKHYRTLDEFLADAGIDLVVVCTGPDTHAEIGLKAIKAGKHVLIEKPMTVTSAEADQLLAAAEEARVILSVYQNRRYDSDFLTLCSVLPHLGKVHEVTIQHDIPDAPFIHRIPAQRVEGAGMAYTAGSHIVDQALILFGRPTSVTAFFRSLRADDKSVEALTEDSYTIMLGYEPDPLLVTLKTNARSIMPRQMTHFVRGTQGTFVNFGNDVQFGQASQGMLPGSKGWGVSSSREDWAEVSTKQRVQLPGLEQQQVSGIWTGKVPPIKGDWPGFYRDLASRVRGDTQVGVGSAIPRDGIRILELAWRSAQEGRTVPAEF